MKDLRQFLKTISNISESELDNSLQYFRAKRLTKGDYFVNEGEVCYQIAYIQSGLLRTYYYNEKAEGVTSCFCSAGSLTTSYKSFILKTPSTLSIKALTDCELLVLESDDLDQLYEKYTVWQSIGRSVAEQEYILMEQYASVLNNETAKQKYLRLLEEQPDVLSSANVEDIASYLGVTRRTLSRIRKEMLE